MRRLILAAAVCLIGPPASAQTPTYAYRWSSDGGATLLPSGSATVSYGAPNSTVTLRLFVTQSGGSPATLSSPGLFSVGARVSFTNAANGAAVTSAGSIAVNSAQFEFAPFSSLGSGFADVSLSTFTSGVTSTNSRVFVADYTFTVQGTGTADTTVTAFSPTNLANDHLYPTVLASGSDISSSLGTATVTLVPVPEPAGLLAAAGLVPVARRLRRRGSSS